MISSSSVRRLASLHFFPSVTVPLRNAWQWAGVGVNAAANYEGDSWGLGRFGCRDDGVRWPAQWDSLHTRRLFEGAHRMQCAGAHVASLSALGLPFRLAKLSSVEPMVRSPATRGRYISDKRGMETVGFALQKRSVTSPLRQRGGGVPCRGPVFPPLRLPPATHHPDRRITVTRGRTPKRQSPPLPA